MAWAEDHAFARVRGFFRPALVFLEEERAGVLRESPPLLGLSSEQRQGFDDKISAAAFNLLGAKA